MSKRSVLPFLLGALYSRIVINEAYRLRYGVMALFPEPKSWVPAMLQRHIGGSIFVKQNKRGASVCYHIKAKKDLARLEQALLRYYRDIPDLIAFLSLFRKREKIPIPGVEKIRRQPRGRSTKRRPFPFRRMD